MRRANLGLVHVAMCGVAILSLAPSLPSNSRNHVSRVKETDAMPVRRVDSDYQSDSSFHLIKPLELAVDRQNNLYIADVEKAAIFKVDTSGAITVVAGTGKPGHVRDGVPATRASLVRPLKVVVDDEGNLYIADGGAYRIFKVDAKGILNIVAGTGAEGPGGDGGPALAATLASPHGLAVATDLSLFILDGINNRIRKVDSDGGIRTIAGTGEKGYGGDGGPATAARLNWPSDIAVDRAGNLFVADNFNYRIRKVDHQGIITTVAGNGTQGNNADGIAATAAWMGVPCSIAVDDSGNLFIVDTGNHRISRVDTSGVITTVVGVEVGNKGHSNTGGLAKVGLDRPFAVAVDHEGSLYIADWDSEYTKTRVRKVSVAGFVTTVFTDPLSVAQ